MVLAESYGELMTNWSHIAFELSWEAITAVVGFPLGVLYQRWHDRKHHPERGGPF